MAGRVEIGITVAAMSATKSTFAIRHRIGFVIWDSWPDSVNWKAMFDSGKRYFLGTEQYIYICVCITLMSKQTSQKNCETQV